MNCNETTTLVTAYADGELDRLRSHSIEKHLRDCAACATKHQGVLDLRARIRAEAPYFAAPPALHARVRATLGAMSAAAVPQRRPTADRRRWFSGGVLAGCAASVLAWVLGSA